MGARPVPALGPAVARILRQYPTIRLGLVRPSGKNGRILKGDVLAAMEDGSAYGDGEASTGGGDSPPPASGAALSSQSAPPPVPQRAATAAAPPARPGAAQQPPLPAGVPAMDASTGGSRVKFVDEPLTATRRTIASRLLASKQHVPHRYTSASFELDALEAWRASLNAAARPAAPPLTLNDFCVWASAAALSAVPEVRATWDAAAGQRVPSPSADVAFAVAVPDGLLTPVVWDAGRKGLAAIAADTAVLAERARRGELQPAEHSGGCFCVTNLGEAGVVGAIRSIIHPPHAGNLAVGTGLPASRTSPTGYREALVATATLSSDARVVSEAAAAEFVAAFARVMGDPEASIF